MEAGVYEVTNGARINSMHGHVGLLIFNDTQQRWIYTVDRLDTKIWYYVTVTFTETAMAIFINGCPVKITQMGNNVGGIPFNIIADTAAKSRAIVIGQDLWYKNAADDDHGGSWSALYDAAVQNGQSVFNPHANLDKVIIIDKAMDDESVWGLYQAQFS